MPKTIRDLMGPPRMAATCLPKEQISRSCYEYAFTHYKEKEEESTGQLFPELAPRVLQTFAKLTLYTSLTKGAILLMI